jgi:hypothetical protein
LQTTFLGDTDNHNFIHRLQLVLRIQRHHLHRPASRPRAVAFVVWHRSGAPLATRWSPSSPLRPWQVSLPLTPEVPGAQAMTVALGVSVDPWLYKAGLSIVPGSTTRSAGPRVVLLQVVEGQWATYPLGDVQSARCGTMQCSGRRYHRVQERDAMHLLSCGTPSSDCICIWMFAALPRYSLPSRAVPCRNCFTMHFVADLCCSLLCYTVPCCVTLCLAVLHCSLLCYTVPCCVSCSSWSGQFVQLWPWSHHSHPGESGVFLRWAILPAFLVIN